MGGARRRRSGLENLFCLMGQVQISQLNLSLMRCYFAVKQTLFKLMEISSYKYSCPVYRVKHLFFFLVQVFDDVTCWRPPVLYILFVIFVDEFLLYLLNMF